MQYIDYTWRQTGDVHVSDVQDDLVQLNAVGRWDFFGLCILLRAVNIYLKYSTHS